jgi:hypothetical protein
VRDQSTLTTLTEESFFMLNVADGGAQPGAAASSISIASRVVAWMGGHFVAVFDSI